jgi:hypothetical protein
MASAIAMMTSCDGFGFYIFTISSDFCRASLALDYQGQKLRTLKKTGYGTWRPS